MIATKSFSKIILILMSWAICATGPAWAEKACTNLYDLKVDYLKGDEAVTAVKKAPNLSNIRDGFKDLVGSDDGVIRPVLVVERPATVAVLTESQMLTRISKELETLSEDLGKAEVELKPMSNKTSEKDFEKLFNGFNGDVALNTTELAQILSKNAAADPDLKFYKGTMSSVDDPSFQSNVLVILDPQNDIALVIVEAADNG